ncbi:MAG TPA: helix-turn-helix domain-containing protein [Microbacterium sp.]|uniref:AraC-like ligand-binding domain-containing protein n=1 Tax=Microbacterium sp. TaxID=51671 RepID=UPI002B4A2162|nr:helix-turn-helix domain-containing protein [Microbacterium sp.]HKT57146.1 helix-turn-helix domain-containing protein [Microbacterium sp.]
MLDTTMTAPDERFDQWSSAVAENFVPLVAEPKDRDGVSGFEGRLVSQSLGRAEISTVQGGAVGVRRSPALIAQSDPGHIKLGLQLRGYSVISQDDRDAALAPGDFALYDTTRPYRLDFDDTFAMFVVMFPIDLLRIDRGTLATVTASRFSGRRGLGAVTSAFLGAMSRQLESEPLAGGLPLSDSVFDLLTATLADRIGAHTDDEASRRRALLMRIEAYISTRIGDPSLTVTAIAAAHHVSVRYLQKLFEEHGETVSGWIRHRRLEQARRDLANPTLLGRSVASVGVSCGFVDAAGFSRAFRSEFGTTPSDFRAGARAA